jgi:hypothetical protein
MHDFTGRHLESQPGQPQTKTRAHHAQAIGTVNLCGSITTVGISSMAAIWLAIRARGSAASTIPPHCRHLDHVDSEKTEGRRAHESTPASCLIRHSSSPVEDDLGSMCQSR